MSSARSASDRPTWRASRAAASSSQELALRHPELVRSLVLQSTWPVMDPYYRSWVRFVQWLVEYAPSERAFLEGFFLDIYTAAGTQRRDRRPVHRGGARVSSQAEGRGPAALPRAAFVDHDTTDRLPQISAPTLVLAGGRDPGARPALGRAVAELIPGAQFEVMEEEAHQPFQEVPDEWNARVDAFWREVAASRPAA